MISFVKCDRLNATGEQFFPSLANVFFGIRLSRE
jgi:hypothetical protein